MQVALPFEVPLNTTEYGLTFRDSKKQPYHRWYPYVEGFSAPYVSGVLKRFAPVERILDPFGGAGTTQVEASANGIQVYYSELNPFMQFVSDTKVNAAIWARGNLDSVRRSVAAFIDCLHESSFAEQVKDVSTGTYLQAFGSRDFFEEKHLRELLVCRNIGEQIADTPNCRSLLLLAVAANTVRSSNMTRRADLRRRRSDEYKDRIVDVRSFIIEKLSEIIEDLRAEFAPKVPATLICNNAKDVGNYVEDIDLAITSPPYLNGTNYCRNTKLEQWLLGWLRTESDLRSFRDNAIAAGINNVNSTRKTFHEFASIERVAKELEQRDGDRRIPQLVRSYFSDMYEVLVAVRKTLRPGGRFILDIGDSKFYGVHVPTDTLLAEVAANAGFELEETRMLARRYSHDRSELRQVELTFRKQARTATPHTSEKAHTRNRRPSTLQSKIDTFASALPYKEEPYDSRAWGHPLHSLCCYQGKLKPSIAHFLVDRFTEPGMSVLDPLGGVGTVALEACLQGRVGITNDLSPLAYSVATPKVQFPDLPMVQVSLDAFASALGHERVDNTDFQAASFGLNGAVEDFYHPDTLVEVLKSRRYFSQLVSPSVADLLVKAAMLHVLHGNRPYALSRTSHPITPFHPSGEAVYKPVLEHVRQRILHLYRRELPPTFIAGESRFGDFRALAAHDPVDAIITSPPFWGMRFDRPNWLRMWFCGWTAEDFHNTSRGFLERQQTVSLDIYRDFFLLCRKLLRKEGVMILHLGGSPKHDMLGTLERLAKESFKVLAIVTEDSTTHEHHGIKDKGLTTTHNFIFLQ